MLRSAALPVMLVVAGLACLVVGLLQTPLTFDSPSAAGEVLAASSEATAAAPAPSVRQVPTRFASRIVIDELGIDLPVIRQPGVPGSYPPCNVAMYLQALASPGYPGATYIYAHARDGMFLPILEASVKNDGEAMIGMIVRVYTTDSLVFTYRIERVHRHVASLAPALAATKQELWLQTSEGPRGTVGKVEVVARPVNEARAPISEAHPSAHPVPCGT
jgi:hypothetical protein